jgi:hypothetical protein
MNEIDSFPGDDGRHAHIACVTCGGVACFLLFGHGGGEFTAAHHTHRGQQDGRGNSELFG